MNRNEDWEKMKQEYKEVKVPEHGKEQMAAAIRRAKMDKKRMQKKKMVRNFGIGLAAALALVVLPNTNENIAYAMENIPVIGGIFKVVTIRDYSHQDNHNEANVKVPKIIDENTEDVLESEAVNEINKSVEEWTNELVAKFEAEMSDQGYRGLDVTYETVTDTEDWFTLAVQGLEVSASGYQFSRYYHINKATGENAALKDIFKEGSDYKTPINEEILRQMKEQMDAGESIYFITEEDMDPFTSIKDDQNFYFNQQGELVIVFDEYEVGPGYIGSPQFVIPKDVIEEIILSFH